METAQTSDNQRKQLNNLYRFQRHFYDLTRRFFLFGRDDLLRQMNVLPGERVLEVGCGTGRNLLKLAQIQPEAKIYGLDASDEMLKTAGAKLDAQNQQKAIVLRQGLAEQFDYQTTFNLDQPFDKIFISYSLSMFPNWREAILNAIENLKPEGDFYILDFWDGAGLPGWFVGLRAWWLSLFKVYYRSEFLEFLKELQLQSAGKFTVRAVGTNYAFIVHFQKVLIS
ncbi:MAG TPA: methyltransferase domain-containing protein [Pyrinomonadaceae bacterium]|nr:methyltransferase domain-containing protein [Pyrinomonadaceae bacterium]